MMRSNARSHRTLIITVGTRQAGWRCADHTVCCFGADGDRNEYPRHIDRLFQELGVKRDKHQGKAWGVCELSRLYYQYCQEKLAGDFSAVELLLDHQVIEDQYSQGLAHIVLWGTNQPESTDWSYRNKDTRWLAYLMAGKIQQTWPELTVEVFEPVVDANDNRAIRQALDSFIVKHAQLLSIEEDQTEFTLLIQSKGAVPAIAQSLEICSAGLVRQFQVFNVVPHEPESLFSRETQSANRSVQNQVIPIGEYFWPIERLRIVSAWQRGDFHEAALWLVAHQSQYRVIYRLATYLTLTTNWQLKAFFKPKQGGISQWLSMDSLKQLVDASQLEAWRKNAACISKSQSAQAWETSFLIYLLLLQGNYTDAFMRFSQTLERLLYIRSKEGGWLNHDTLNGRHPGFKQLIDQWFEIQGKPNKTLLYRQFDRIRNTRNQIVHNAESMTIQDVKSIWRSDWNLEKRSSSIPEMAEVDNLHFLMTQSLRQVCDEAWETPEETLLYSLYKWGLNLLKNE